jgi:hypothetical protein
MLQRAERAEDPHLERPACRREIELRDRRDEEFVARRVDEMIERSHASAERFRLLLVLQIDDFTAGAASDPSNGLRYPFAASRRHGHYRAPRCCRESSRETDSRRATQDHDALLIQRTVHVRHLHGERCAGGATRESEYGSRSR